jgi:hypothetical protein
VNSLTGQCDNPTCSDENHSESQLTYNLLVDISDQSGTIINCRMMSSALETVLGYPVSFGHKFCIRFVHKVDMHLKRSLVYSGPYPNHW